MSRYEQLMAAGGPQIIIIIIIIHEYYYGGAVALLLQDHLTMSVTEQSQYLSATVQREHKTDAGDEQCLRCGCSSRSSTVLLHAHNTPLS